MTPMGWETLSQWGQDVARIAPLAGGVANDVWSVRINGHHAVGRLGTRSDADLAWETELLQYLDREGLPVPAPIPTTDGRLFADGVVVMTYVEGGPPETEADWRRVADTLRRLHRLTQGWPQRLERRALSWNRGFPKSANCDSPCSEVDHGAKLLFGPAQAGRFPCRRRPISSRCGSGFAGEPVVLGQAGGAPSPHRHTGAAAARPPAWHRQARALSRLPDATREGNARYHHARAGR